MPTNPSRIARRTRSARGARRPLLACAALALLVAACGRAPAPATPAPSAAPTAATGEPTAAGAAAPSAAAAPATGATPPAAGLDGEQRVRALRDSLATLTKVEGRWTRGDTDSAYVAWFDGDQLRYLEEDATVAGRGHRQGRYAFENGELYYYTGERPAGAGAGGGTSAMSENVPVVAEFRGTELVRGIAREHYGEVKLDSAAVAGIRGHAAALAGAAQDEWSARAR